MNKKLSLWISEINSISNRVIYKIIKLKKRYNIYFIHGYEPTSKADNEEMETFLEAINFHRTHHCVISANFDAKISRIVKWAQIN